MNITQKSQPIIHQDDHAIILTYLGTEATDPLKAKLEQAKIVPQDEFPRDVVRLHSRVVVRDKMARMNFTYHVALPGSNQSVVAPIGMAILGLQKGEEVRLQERNGKKYYIVMEVSNPAG
ncbi:GreA/GreB family elongation factor [Chitinophaga alhagiae]|uniref:GreA/GreB family elongation factor n=1 Tax=Chitinophaga alhagiae TaxID=2203219 RepID=UPI000E5BA632|nr:GreA/GreB family elongation factor [Chitinophaga alhagiae]